MTSKIANRHFRRRQFLVGSGSACLALPALSSLMPRTAAAQATSPKRRFAVMLGINGIDAEHLYPNPTDLTKYPDAQHISYKPLNTFTGNVSRLIDADFVPLYPKMNLIQGMSLAYGNFIGHNTAVLGGAGFDRVGGGAFGRSLDVVMEKSPDVYKAGDVPPFRAIRLASGSNGRNDRHFTYDNYGGANVTSDCLQGDRALFNRLFATFTAGGAPAPAAVSADKLIVDKVYGDFKALEANPKLSANDKTVLNQYVDAIFELQQKVKAANLAPPITCTKPAPSLQAGTDGWQSSTNLSLTYDNINQMIQLAFACDLTRIVYLGVAQACGNTGAFADNHHGTPGGSAGAADMQKWNLKKFLGLAKLLDAATDPSGTGTLLDASGMLYTNELGSWTEAHNLFNIPTVTFGSLGGSLRTGNYVDFRQKPFVRISGLDEFNPGRPHKQLLQAMMAGMGVQKSEYVQYGKSGFGQFSPSCKGVSTVYAPFAAEHNDPLPFLYKG